MKRLRISVFLLIALAIACVQSMAADKIYTPIPDVPQGINDLGKAIATEQVAVVTPGGTEFSPNFSDKDKEKFSKSDKMNKILERVTASKTFGEEIALIQSLPSKTRSIVWEKYLTVVYPTWAMNGHMGNDGTTAAGYAVETEIATTLTNAIKAFVAVADFRYQIRAAQIEVVIPGGTEEAPNFSEANKIAFEKSDKLKKIVEKFTGAETFAGNVLAFKFLTEKSQAVAIENFSIPVWKTWEMIGKVGNIGTTKAGYEVEKAIIAEMVKAIKTALK